MFLSCRDVISKSLSTQVIDWQRHRAVVSKYNLKMIQACGIWVQRTQIQSDRIPSHISTFSANSISATPTLHMWMFWGGWLWLFWLIRSAVGATHGNHYITHPANSSLMLCPSPSVVLLVVMMMSGYADSMTDPVPVYVWVWLILLIRLSPPSGRV